MGSVDKQFRQSIQNNCIPDLMNVVRLPRSQKIFYSFHELPVCCLQDILFYTCGSYDLNGDLHAISLEREVNPAPPTNK